MISLKNKRTISNKDTEKNQESNLKGGAPLRNGQILNDKKTLRKALNLRKMNDDSNEEIEKNEQSKEIKQRIKTILKNPNYSLSSKSALISDLIEEFRTRRIIDLEKKRLLPPNQTF